MHRELLNTSAGEIVDHVDGNGLNNTKSNIRLCTSSQNKMNHHARKSKSGYKGVAWQASGNKWQAQIQTHSTCSYLGVFFCLIKAAKAYDKAATERFGEFANLNFPLPKGE
jgi:hypothetical protein